MTTQFYLHSDRAHQIIENPIIGVTVSGKPEDGCYKITIEYETEATLGWIISAIWRAGHASGKAGIL